MSNVINFSQLKRREIRCLIYTDNEGIVQTEYSSEKIENLQEELENPILVYNIDPKTQIKLQSIISKAGTNIYKEEKDILVTAKELILDYLPLCTNIKLDLDAELDKGIIEEIINDPSEEFERVIKEVSKIVHKTGEDYAENIKAFSKLSKEEQKKILKESQPKIEETPEEKELRELKERQKELENIMNNKSEK